MSLIRILNSPKLTWIVVGGLIAFAVVVMSLLTAGKLQVEGAVTVQAIVGFFALVTSTILGLLSRQVLQQIRDSLSTKYLGEFPDHVPDITKLIQGARRELLIVCDFPGYATISSPNHSEKYRVAICTAAANGVKIRCVFLDKEGSAEAVRRQFAAPRTGLDEFLRRTVPRDRAEELLKQVKLVPKELILLDPKIRIPTDPSGVDYKTFEELLWLVNQNICKGMFKQNHVEYSYVRGPMQLHFWVADGREAIFSIPNNTAADAEPAFHTGDHTLIRSLQCTADRYRDDSTGNPDSSRV